MDIKTRTSFPKVLFKKWPSRWNLLPSPLLELNRVKENDTQPSVNKVMYFQEHKFVSFEILHELFCSLQSFLMYNIVDQ